MRASVGGLLAILRENPDLTRIGFFQADSAEDLKDELARMIAARVRLGSRPACSAPRFRPSCSRMR